MKLNQTSNYEGSRTASGTGIDEKDSIKDSIDLNSEGLRDFNEEI